MTEKYKQIFEDLRQYLKQLRNNIVDESYNTEIGSNHYDYLSGQKEIIDDIVSFISNKINNE